MIKTVRENIGAPYSLHDMNVIAFEVDGEYMAMRTQSGMCRTVPPLGQPDGYVEFHRVQWDFSYVYLLNFTGNVGTFGGRKMFLKEFIESYPQMSFCIMDETYGYNCTRYTGYLNSDKTFGECIVEIYHEGNMVFVEE